MLSFVTLSVIILSANMVLVVRLNATELRVILLSFAVPLVLLCCLSLE
jgi:hypothetical protein